ncbi:peptidoglycan recognition protein [Streptomyces sp. NBC_00091]|uniref:peptidoglycan recognition protein family protein n=1 Tax=Streptomyces sp. NBC_00091 TaxID=2975648 RepID=UPI002253A348|nr:peptidoglycan recognition protein [Streptomyces sp. NBC_00091]MCX5380577.1 peptidoglycan recognition protein [Streptomyces sp. NBC_00091]
MRTRGFPPSPVAAALTCLLVALAAVGDRPAGPPPPRGVTRTSAGAAAVLEDARTPFSMLAVTAPAGRGAQGGTYRVRARARASGAWSPWTVVEAGEPWWAGPSAGVEVRADGAGARLPAGLRLDLVDPGPGPAAGAEPAAYAVAGTAARPRIVPRAGWGAVENPGDPTVYGREVKAVFLHHTAQSNDYDCADSPAVVRGLQALHQRVNGWKDLGYNYVVDKCGTVFEGRAGGSGRPVTGAHTLGFNNDTLGVAVIGRYSDREAEPAATAAVARLAAWALGRYGYDPAGTVTLTASIDNGRSRAGERVTVERISGHRDVFTTECPGTALYGQLPAIRAQASDPVTGLVGGLVPPRRGR